MKIVEIREATKPIRSPIRNAYIDFSKMTLSLVAVITDVVREGKRVVGYGFNSNGRYGQGCLIQERIRPRILEADAKALLDDNGDNLDPHKVWACMMANEKPGGHGERSVAVGTIDMAVWDAVAKIEGKPLFQLLADRYGNGKPNKRVFVYAAGGYYYPGQDLDALKREMLSYTERGYTVVKKKIGGATLDDDRRRIEAILGVLKPGQKLAVDANGRFELDTAIAYAKTLSQYDLFWYEEPGDPLDYELQAELAKHYDGSMATGEDLLLDAGRAQPDPLWRYAQGPRLAAVRLRAELRPGGVPAHPGDAARVRLVARAVHPARRTPDVAQHRRRPRPWRQRVLSRSLPTVWRIPRRSESRGWAPHDAGAPGHRIRGEGRSVCRNEGAWRVSARCSLRLDVCRPKYEPETSRRPA